MDDLVQLENLPSDELLELEALPPGDLDALTGLVLDGKYRLGALLGSGAMAHVYEAEQLRLGRTVAVKMLRVSLSTDARSLARFRTEALAASRVNHPHAVAIFDVGVTPDGAPYLVMERAHGRSLAELQVAESFPPPRIVAIGAQILAALDEAHARGVVHRDLKTENVVVETRRDGDDFVKVVDFGIAALLDDPDASVVGTPEYMAPEQIRGELAMPSSDVYAAGILLYELVTGCTPFAGGALHDILERHLTEAPRPPGQLAPCPPGLSQVILRALAKEPADRFESAGEMRAALLACVPRLAGGTNAPSAQRTITCPPRQLAVGDSLIGRDELVARVARFLRGGGDAPALALCGASGVGKASIARAAARGLDREAPVFIAGADPSGLAISWLPVLSMLQAALGLPARPDAEHLAFAVVAAGLPERHASGLAELFGVPSPLSQLDTAVRQREAVEAALAALARAGGGGPAVLCFLDLDRYDAPSRALITTLAGQLAGTATRLLVTTSDPTLVPPGAGLIGVCGLEPNDALALFARHAGSLAAARLPLDKLIALTSSLPQVIVQLAGWVNLGNQPEAAPRRLVDLIAGRLGQLPAGARHLLQTIAAHGQSAPRAPVAALVGDGFERALELLHVAGLVAIADADLVISDRAVAEVAAECTPANGRRVLARAILDERRAELSAAEAAHHAEQAGELAAALGHSLAAGDDAARRFDDHRAGGHYHHAVTLARRLHAQGDADGAERLVEASLRLTEVLARGGKLPLAAGCLDEAEPLAAAPALKAEIARERGRLAARSGQAGVAAEHLRRAIGLALRSGAMHTVCDAYLDLGAALSAVGRLDEATHELGEAITVLSLGDGLNGEAGPERMWEIGWRLALVHMRAGHSGVARQVARDALRQAQRVRCVLGQGRLHALLRKLEPGAEGESHSTNVLAAARELAGTMAGAELGA